MSNLTVFQFESQEVRFVGTADDPWWVASDVCAILGIAVSLAVNGRERKAQDGSVYHDGGLDEDEKGVAIVNTLGGDQEMSIVNEPGLYRLIFKSRKPVARRFQRWVYHEVLPSIRKTGSYAIPTAVHETAIATPPLLPLPEQRASYVVDFALKVLSITSLSKDLQAIYALEAVGEQVPECRSMIKKLIGPVQEITATPERHVTPTVLGELYQQQHNLPKPIKASDVNIALFNAGLQRKEILTKIDKHSGKERTVNIWHLTETGKEWGIVVKDKARGHDKTVEHVRWLPTVLEAIYLGGGE